MSILRPPPPSSLSPGPIGDDVPLSTKPDKGVFGERMEKSRRRRRPKTSTYAPPPKTDKGTGTETSGPKTSTCCPPPKITPPTDKGDKLSGVPTKLDLALNGPRGPTEVRLKEDGTIEATIDRGKPTISKPSQEQWDQFNKAIMDAGVGNWGKSYNNFTIADKSGWGATINIPGKLALSSHGSADAWPNADGTSSKSETKSFQLFEQAVRDLVKSSLVAPGEETGRPEIAFRGTDITGVPDSFTYSNRHFRGGSDLTFDKNTNQMTYTVYNSRTGDTSQTINIPPEKWTPFLQAVNAAGGKSLNGKSFHDPDPRIADGGSWDMKINDTKFSVGRSENPSINNIHKMLRELTGFANI